MAAIVISLLPVMAFLVMLVVLDNYKLLKPMVLVQAITMGCAAALAALCINKLILLILPTYLLRDAGAPVIEELLKALWPLLLIRRGRIGFIVDGAIIGFAVGSGFAFIENCYYLMHLSHNSLMLWIVRGFGTALMHGGTTAICIMIAVSAEQWRKKRLYWIGLPVAMLIHAFFNLFLLPPLYNALLQMVGLPLLLMTLFASSEKQTAIWLQQGFDTDVALLKQLRNGSFTHTPHGRYLAGFRNSFSGEVVLDLICYLRIHLELAIRAKGILLLRESGLDSPVDATIKSRFEELAYLQKSIGRSGMAILKPLLHTSRKELWQIYFLQEQK